MKKIVGSKESARVKYKDKIRAELRLIGELWHFCNIAKSRWF